MANVIYPLYKQSLLVGDTNTTLNINTTNDGVYVSLIDTGLYTYSPAHRFYSDLAGIVGTPQRITNATVVAGLFDGDNVTFPTVSGASVEALVLYRRNSGSNTTWRLVLYIDASVGGLPITPNGQNIDTVWNNSGIFLL